MNNLSYRKKFWLGSRDRAFSYITVATKEYMHLVMREYNNVAVIMCQQYMDLFPEEYCELEENSFPQYMVSASNINNVQS